MRPDSPPEPRYAFGYRQPPRPGNAINGLGEATPRRVRHRFHSAGSERLEWQALDDFFAMVNPWRVVRRILANAWQLRRQSGPVAPERAPERAPVDDPAAMAARVKQRARALGADLVGVTELRDEEDLFEGHTAPYRNAVCLGFAMDREQMCRAPHEPAAVEVMRSYRKAGRVAVELAEHVRELGWGARAYGNPNSTDILHIPLAIRAGLGQLGKHGSLISEEHGSNFRLATVLTELPLAPDRSVDLAVDDLCQVCQRCVLDCPPRAIFDARQLVRGQRKWYVDFDRCVPYFVKTAGCAICLEVCPWSEPGRGPELSRRLLARRDPGAAADATG